jgi:hypothetical protein
VNGFWTALEREAQRLDAVQATALAFVPKRPSQKALRDFEVSIRVSPGNTPASFVQIATLEGLTAGVSGHEALQRAKWHAEVLAVAADVLGLLLHLHGALLDVPSLADCKVLALDATPKIQPTTLWMSTVGHVMATHNLGFTVADGMAQKVYTPVLRTPVAQDAPTWLLTLADKRGFTAFDTAVFQIQANTLEDALQVAHLRHPNRFGQGLDNLHAARVVGTADLELAKRSFATT